MPSSVKKKTSLAAERSESPECLVPFIKVVASELAREFLRLREESLQAEDGEDSSVYRELVVEKEQSNHLKRKKPT